jgi:branched-chain amino acid transport system permease protein
MIGKYKPQLFLLVALAASLGMSLCASRIDDYYLDIMINVGINIILAVSLNLVNGYTGQFSLGHAGFMAVGAYAAAIVSKKLGVQPEGIGEALSFLVALITGGAFAAACGWMVGMPSLRLRGDYLAIVTLGFNEIIRVVLQNTRPDGIFGGALGMKDVPGYTTFFWVFGMAAVATYTVTAMVNSTWGRGFFAVRDDEIAASSMGVPTVRYKVIAFVTGAFFAGIAGGLYGHFRGNFAPEGFNFLKSVDIVVIVILGGMGSMPGVIVAAILLTVLNEYLRDFEQYRMIVFSLLLILMMILRPQGLLPASLFTRKGKSKPA